MLQASRRFQAQISPRGLIGYETTWGLIEIVAAPRSAFQTIRFVLTDMDKTLTYKGSLAARTYEALEQ
jgi:hypothetical protein